MILTFVAKLEALSRYIINLFNILVGGICVDGGSRGANSAFLP